MKELEQNEIKIEFKPSKRIVFAKINQNIENEIRIRMCI